MTDRPEPAAPVGTQLSPSEKRGAKRDAKLSGVAGKGRTWEIVEQFTLDREDTFVSFLGHKGQTGLVLRQTGGPEVTTELPEGQSANRVLVGKGLLKVFRDEYPGSVPSVWVVRAGEQGERWEPNLKDEVVSISFKELKDPSKDEFSGFSDRTAFGEWVNKQLPNKTKKQRESIRDQVWSFRREIQVGELVVMPQGSGMPFAIGRVAKDYEFDAGPEQDENARRRRSVEWRRKDVRPEDVGEDLLRLILSRRTVARLANVDATNRIRYLTDLGVDPGALQSLVPSGDEAGVIDEGGQFVEGTGKTVAVLRFERNPKARQRCIDLHGTSCKVCGIDFGEKYGDFANGYIHVHHKVPVAQAARGGQYQLDPDTDLVPVCPNCHAMLHQHGDNPCTVETLQSEMRSRKQTNTT